MKRIYLNLLAIFALGTVTSSMRATILQNKYGAPVEFIEKGRDAESYSKAAPHHVNKIPNGAQTNLADMFFENALSLRKVGGTFQDVSYILQQVRNEAGQHRGQEAVITINSSYNPVYWSLSVS